MRLNTGSVALPCLRPLSSDFRASDFCKAIDVESNQRFRMGDAFSREVDRRLQDGLLVFSLENIDKIIPAQCDILSQHLHAHGFKRSLIGLDFLGIGLNGLPATLIEGSQRDVNRHNNLLINRISD